MNLPDFILIGVLLIAAASAFYAYTKRKKSGNGCGSCKGCTGCK